MSRFLTFLSGMLTCLLLLAATACLTAKHVAAWTVVSAEPTRADAIVVLGGGDGSRLRVGLRLYDQGYAPRLILVDTKNEAWAYVARKLCTDCVLEGKDVVILDGSVSTQTDAELSLAYCQKIGLKSVLVVTSPYHTRRAKLIFEDVFVEKVTSDSLPVTRKDKSATSDQLPVTSHQSQGFEITAISTNDYGKLLSPVAGWWRDERTLQTVWMEVGKIVYWEVLGGEML